MIDKPDCDRQVIIDSTTAEFSAGHRNITGDVVAGRVHPRRGILRSSKRAVALSKQHLYNPGGAVVVPDQRRDIGYSVSVEVSHNGRSERKCPGIAESPVAVAEQHFCAVVDDGKQIGLSIVV